jgi:hypothetical protein
MRPASYWLAGLRLRPTVLGKKVAQEINRQNADILEWNTIWI